MEEEKYYKVKKSTLLDLLLSYFTLEALESGGVDNWGWHDDTLYLYRKEALEQPEFRAFLEKKYKDDEDFDVSDIDFEDIAEFELEGYEEIE